MEYIIRMIEAGSVIILAVVSTAVLADRFKKSWWVGGAVYGVIFGLTGMIVMSSSVEIIPGIRTDPRNAVLVLSAAFGGPVSALVSTIILSLLRAYFGGLGVFAGIVSMATTAAAASLFWAWWVSYKSKPINRDYIFAHALIALVVPVVSIAFVTAAPAEVFLKSASLFAPTNFFAVLLLGGVIIAEQHRRQMVFAHEESQAQLAGIANNVPNVLFQLSADGNFAKTFTFVSQASKRMLGIDPEALINRKEPLAGHLSDEARADLRAILKKSAETGKAWSFETDFLHPAKGVVNVRLEAEPRRDGDKRLVWDGCISDITAQKRSEKMKHEFIATVSHELRTPLTSIRGSLGLVISACGDTLPAGPQKLLKIAKSNSERLSRLIDDILDIEKIEAGGMSFHLQTVNLCELLGSAAEANAEYMAEKGVTIDLECAANDIPVRVDPDRLNQVVGNLMSNAIKFSPDNGKISVSVKKSGRTVRFAIRDQGVGIPPEFRSRIFGKFEQADGSNTRTEGGSGLGLNISKSIIEQMHGSIGFESQEGHGTEFFVELPLLAVFNEDANQNPGAARMLICEDDPDTTQLISLILREEGIVADVAQDVQSAKRLLRQNRYAAVTLDLKLGQEDGLDLLEAMQEEGLGGDIPVIVISAWVNSIRRAAVEKCGQVVAWIDKPIEMATLRSAAAALLITPQTVAGKRVLHVEDDEHVLALVSSMLDTCARVEPAKTIHDAQALLAQNSYDMVILDLSMPDGSGLNLLEAIPETTKTVVFSVSDALDVMPASLSGMLKKSRGSEMELAKLAKGLLAA